MAITLSGTTLTFNDATTQTTSAIPSSYGGIGGIVYAALSITSAVKPGDTVAGSSVLVVTTISTVTASWYYQSQGVTTNPITRWISGSSAAGGITEQTTTGNVGYQNPGGTTAQSGTWRVLAPAQQRRSVYDGCSNQTFSYCACAILQRIA